MLKYLVLLIYKKLTTKGIYNPDNPEPDVEKWQEFVNSFPNPKDDYEQSYYKYKCRLNFFPFFYPFIINIFAFFAFIYHFPVFLRKSKNININNKEGFLVIKHPVLSYHDVLPEILQDKYGSLNETDKPEINAWFLDRVSQECLRESFRRYPFSFYFNFILFRELAMLSWYKANFPVKAIVVYVYERPFTSPLMTYCCEKENMDFVSFQHGEYLLNFIQTFMKFSTYYVWDKHYSDLFSINLRCTMGSYELYTPLKYQKISNKVININTCDYFITYYLSNESKKRMKMIAEAFSILKNKGHKCNVRPHPRCSDIMLVNDFFKDFDIEDPNETSIGDSLRRSQYPVALISTVLSEAFYGGKTVVIDDYSEPDRYHSLEKRKYIILDKPHILLTQILRDC